MAQDTKKTASLTEEQLIEREAALKFAEQKLTEDHENLVLEKNKFEEEKAAFESEKATLEKAKTDLEAREKSLAEKSDVKSVKKINPVSFEFEGEKYQFSAKAPQSILLNGKPVSQKEIAKNDEFKLQLIGGNSSLIIKK